MAASVQSGYAIGYAISVALLPIISSLFPEEIGWRVVFAIGIVPAFLVFFIRRLVPESGVYADAKAARAAGASTTPFWEIFARAHLRRTAAALIMATGIFGGAYVIYWLKFDAVGPGGPVWPDGFDLHWRVTNTDREAVQANTLRGDFYLSNDGASSRWEQLSYRGVHLVEAFVIRKRDSTLVGTSSPFYVVIE